MLHYFFSPFYIVFDIVSMYNKGNILFFDRFTSNGVGWVVGGNILREMSLEIVYSDASFAD